MSVQSTLSSYLADTRRLLKDPSPGVTFTDSDLISFINRSMHQRELDLGVYRAKYSFSMTTGKSSYTFSEILSMGSYMIGSTNANMIDVFSWIVIPLGGSTSAVRYPLGKRSYSEIAPLLSTSYPTYPVAFSMYGDQTVVVAPPPANNYYTEVDFIGYGQDLVNMTDVDPIAYPYTDPVPFMAASFAKLNLQRFDEADKFESLYMARLRRVLARSRPLAMTDPWSNWIFKKH